MAQFEQLYVRPEHPTTAKAMTFRDEVLTRLPFCSDILHAWAMDLVTGNHTVLSRMDPLSSPDLLFPMPNRSSPLCYVTPSDENRGNAEALMAAWEALIALFFFAITQIIRLCTEHEQIDRSPFASYHQNALVSPDTLSLVLPDKFRNIIHQWLCMDCALIIRRHKPLLKNGEAKFMLAPLVR